MTTTGLYNWTTNCCDACWLPCTSSELKGKSIDDNGNDATVGADRTNAPENRRTVEPQPKTRLLVCQGCKCFAYHDAQCQRKHWKKGHKKDCMMIRTGLQPLVRLLRICEGNRSNDGQCWWQNIYGTTDRFDMEQIWSASVNRWNFQQAYLYAFEGFQQAMLPVMKAWERHHSTDSMRTTDTSDDEDHPAFFIQLSQRLLFCAYCEADSSQVEKARDRLVQCISLLLHLRQKLDQNSRQRPKIDETLNDAWMELMLSYDEAPQLRRLTRHVAHLAIQFSDGEAFLCCGWLDPLQRPGYMAALDDNDKFSRLAFVPREQHPSWCKVLEDHSKDILQDLLQLGASPSRASQDWSIVGSGDRGSGRGDHRVVSAGGKWTEYVLFGTGGQPTDQDAPLTKSLLRRYVPDAVSLATSGGGEVIFSRLAPRTFIEAHCGPTNLRWTCHLGLIVPNGSNGECCGKNSGKCQIRVGNSWHSWQNGKAIIFDDSWEHEVVNDTAEERIVLLLRLWHPSLDCQQREAHLRQARVQKESNLTKRYHPPE